MSKMNNKNLIIIFLCGLFFFIGYMGSNLKNQQKVESLEKEIADIKININEMHFYARQLDLGTEIAILERINEEPSHERWLILKPRIKERFQKKIALAKQELNNTTNESHKLTLKKKIKLAEETLNNS